MSNIRRWLAAVPAVASFATVTAVLAVAWLVAVPGRAMADTNDYTVTDMNVDFYPTNKDPQGEMRIVEKIKVHFTDNNHGLDRALPEKYRKKSLQVRVNSVSSESGAPAQYTMYESNGNKVLHIGDRNKTVTGDQEYTIDYTVSNVITFQQNSTELYWNVNGVGWGQPFDHVLGIVHLPPGLKLSGNEDKQMECFAGEQNSTDRNCTIADDGEAVYAETIKPLKQYATLSMVIGFDQGYFRPETASETAKDNAVPVASLLVMPVLVSLVGLVVWLKKGRDPKGKGTIIVQYEPPAGLSPLDAGVLVDFRAKDKDLSALLISLAIRKYLRIVETKKDHLLGKDTLSYRLILLTTDYSALTEDEKLLLGGLFPVPAVGAALDLDKAGSKLYRTAARLRDQASRRLVQAGYFAGDPQKAGKMFVLAGSIFLGVVLLLSALLTPWVLAGAFAAAVMCLVFWRIMPARTAKGVEAIEHLKGLKMYLTTAEADRIKMLQAPNAPYAANAAEPVRNVELFEKLLPYAMVLEVEQEWAKQFEGLYQQPPEWYSGTSNAFTTGYLVGSLQNSFAASVTNSFAAPSSSSSSGFGGGGFAGGGGGGGGGGGW